VSELIMNINDSRTCLCSPSAKHLANTFWGMLGAR